MNGDDRSHGEAAMQPFFPLESHSPGSRFEGPALWSLRASGYAGGIIMELYRPRNGTMTTQWVGESGVPRVLPGVMTDSPAFFIHLTQTE